MYKTLVLPCGTLLQTTLTDLRITGISPNDGIITIIINFNSIDALKNAFINDTELHITGTSLNDGINTVIINMNSLKAFKDFISPLMDNIKH